MTDYEKIKVATETFIKGLVANNPELEVVTVTFGWAETSNEELKNQRPSGIIVPKGDQLSLQHAVQLIDMGHLVARHAALQIVQTMHATSLELETYKLKAATV